MQQHRAQGKLVALGVLSMVLAIVVLPGVSQAAEPQPKVTEGKLVSLEYTLTLDDKSVVDSNVGEKPLTYTHGSHQIVPGLEKALEGMAVGDTKQVTVAPAEGYGETNPKALQEVQKQLLPPEALKVGARLQGKAPNGQMVYPLVSEIKTDTVVLDFNHPLAGKTLHFDVKVVDVQQTQAEPKTEQKN